MGAPQPRDIAEFRTFEAVLLWSEAMGLGLAGGSADMIFCQ